MPHCARAAAAAAPFGYGRRCVDRSWSLTLSAVGRPPHSAHRPSRHCPRRASQGPQRSHRCCHRRRLCSGGGGGSAGALTPAVARSEEARAARSAKVPTAARPSRHWAATTPRQETVVARAAAAVAGPPRRPQLVEPPRDGTPSVTAAATVRAAFPAMSPATGKAVAAEEKVVMAKRTGDPRHRVVGVRPTHPLKKKEELHIGVILDLGSSPSRDASRSDPTADCKNVGKGGHAPNGGDQLLLPLDPHRAPHIFDTRERRWHVVNRHHLCRHHQQPVE